MKSHFDTSNYPKEHYLFSNDNKVVPRLFKDECSGSVISEFVGLRSKLYHILIDDSKTQQIGCCWGEEEHSLQVFTS